MLPRKFCEYKDSKKCSAVAPDCVCGRDAAKKVRDAENKVKKLKKEVDELKKQPDAAAQMGAGSCCISPSSEMFRARPR